MAEKVQFVGVDKLIIVKDGITNIDFKTDVYSTWKEWLFEVTGSTPNAKYFPALRIVGGDPTVGSGSISPYFFFINGWRMRPHEADHQLSIDGNVALDSTETGSSYLVPTLGGYTVLAPTVFSNSATTVTLTVNEGSGLSVSEQSKLDELWRIHGLNSAQPLIVTPTSRLVGDVTQSIVTGSGDDVTVTRL